MAGEIVLGYDASDGAKAALPQATAVAKSFGAALIVAFGYLPDPRGGEVGDLARKLKARGETVTTEGVEAVRRLDPSIAVEAAVVGDRPTESLVELAIQRGARMIVVGGNGRGPIAGALLGSVAYKLLHRSTVPVLVVQPTD